MHQCAGTQLHDEAPEPWHQDGQPAWRMLEHVPVRSRLALERRGAYPVDVRVVRESLEDAGATYAIHTTEQWGGCDGVKDAALQFVRITRP